ncbi:MAG TPA: response regulator [Myxococcales bacterium]|nr:response regulator [Myxococcales bacterium]
MDDAKIVLRVVERALSEAGFTLSVAEDAEGALALLEERQFACALVDRNLVEADGLDLIKEIRSRQQRCACILMTAYPSLESAVQALRMGVVDYIQKPSRDFERIVDRVQNAIRLHGGRSGEEEERAPEPQPALAHAAESLVSALRALETQVKPRARAALNRTLADAEAHARALRKR